MSEAEKESTLNSIIELIESKIDREGCDGCGVIGDSDVQNLAEQIMEFCYDL